MSCISILGDCEGMGRRPDGGDHGAARKVGVAVVFGAFMGLIWSVYHPHSLFSAASFSTYVVSSVSCDTTSKVQSSDADVSVLQEEIVLLKVHLKRAEQERDAAVNQLQALGPSVKAGALGTVRSLRTNPSVQPDVASNTELAKLLEGLAPSKELIVGIADNNVRDMVRVWLSCIKKVGITNYLIVALDDEIAKFCKLNRVPFYRKNVTIPAMQEDAGTNHAVSGLKFQLLRDFLVLGYSVLLSDVDIVFFQNPFLYLYRDCDVEGMSDGHTNQTAYGYNDVSDDPKMGWARYAHTMRIWVFNSGLFYIRPTIPAIELLDRVTTRLANEKAWDQAVFNEEIFFPSHPGYEGLHASKRVMDYYLFMNSKVMFTQVRKDPNFDSFRPVSVHINYHPDKYERMLALIAYYSKGRKEALKGFPDGSE